MAGSVFVSGGSGFVGRSVIEQLIARGYSVNALVNRKKLELAGGVRSFPGGIFDPAAINAAMAGCVAAVHLVGIIMEDPGRGITFEKIHFEGSRNVVDAAGRSGIQRYIHMSALGTRANAASEYHKTKWKAEEYVRASGLDWTILRPSLIHGPRGEFMQQASKWARMRSPPFFFMPYFGKGLLGLGGAGLLQPVYVEDVARAFVDAIENPKTIGHAYDLAGQTRLTWPQLHKTISRAVVGRNRLTMPIPAWYASLLTRIIPQSWLGFNRDQVIMSREDNTGDLSPFVRDFGLEPGGFEKSLQGYAAQLNAK